MKVCPKCRSSRIAKINNSVGQQFNHIKLGLLTIADVSRYVCCDCGYTEEWLEKQKDLKKIAEMYLD